MQSQMLTCYLPWCSVDRRLYTPTNNRPQSDYFRPFIKLKVNNQSHIAYKEHMH